MSACLILLAGCGQAVKEQSQQIKNKPQIETPPVANKVTTNAGPGTADRFSPLTTTPEKEKLWTIRWEEARISLEGDNPTAGRLKVVSGVIFRKKTEIGTFKSKTGTSDRPEDELELVGDVVLISLETKSRIECDRLIYRPRKNYLEAHGNVRISGPQFTGKLGNEVWANVELTKVGTPEVFKSL